MMSLKPIYLLQEQVIIIILRQPFSYSYPPVSQSQSVFHGMTQSQIMYFLEYGSTCTPHK